MGSDRFCFFACFISNLDNYKANNLEYLTSFSVSFFFIIQNKPVIFFFSFKASLKVKYSFFILYGLFGLIFGTH